MSNFLEKCRKAVQTTDGMARGEKYTKAEQQWITETRDRLAQRRGKKPATKAGQLRALWPEIRVAIAEGQSLATICHWLAEEAGIAVTVQSLGSYLTRMRRKERTAPIAPAPPTVTVPLAKPIRSSQTKTPVNVRKPRGFEYPPGPPDESKLI